MVKVICLCFFYLDTRLEPPGINFIKRLVVLLQLELLSFRRYRIRLNVPIFFQQFSNSFVCGSNEQIKKCKSVNLLFFLHVYFAQIAKECNQICILFLSNQSNMEVCNMTSKSNVVTIPY